MLRPPFSSLLAVASGFLLGIVVLISIGFTNQLQRENSALGTEAMRLRSMLEAAQSRLGKLEQAAASDRDRLAQEQRALEGLRTQSKTLSSALAEALARIERLEEEKAAGLAGLAAERRVVASLESELAELRRRLAASTILVPNPEPVPASGAPEPQRTELPGGEPKSGARAAKAEPEAPPRASTKERRAAPAEPQPRPKRPPARQTELGSEAATAPPPARNPFE